MTYSSSPSPRRARLSDATVRRIVQLHVQEQLSATAISELTSVSAASVSLILVGRSYLHVTGGINVSRARRLTGYRRAVLQWRRAQDPSVSLGTVAAELGISRQGVHNLSTAATPAHFARRQPGAPATIRTSVLTSDTRWYEITPGTSAADKVGYLAVTTANPSSSGHGLTSILACTSSGAISSTNDLFGGPFDVAGDHAAALRIAGYLLIDCSTNSTTTQGEH
ncbi:hypothetical protein [Nocardia salmonicida]|uniref:hypothetical protein n=1 Tax=Nocardia salmonicida TaxID=53431 RepID=UPI000B16E0A4|nr:hypothetical protein [Nocardia salmonicida]